MARRFGRSESRRGWIVVIALAFGGALWFRFRHRGSESPPAPAPTPTAVPAPPPPPAPDAVAAAPEPAPPPAPAPPEDEPGSGLVMVRLSSDGQHALLYKESETGSPAHLRSVAVDTGAIEADVELGSLRVPADGEPATPPDPAARAADLARARALLAVFPLGAAGFMASSADATRGVYAVGDTLVQITGDKLGAPIKLAAAYEPMILPDGKTLVMRGYAGEIDGPGTGKYAVFSMPLDRGKPGELAGTEGYNGQWALNAAGDALRVVISDPPATKACVAEIALGKALRLGTQRCVASGVLANLSPHGDRIAWESIGGNRVRTMDFATGTIELDVAADSVIAISDAGQLLFKRGGKTYSDVAGQLREVTLPDREDCEFRGSDHLVCGNRGKVSVTDLTNHE